MGARASPIGPVDWLWQKSWPDESCYKILSSVLCRATGKHSLYYTLWIVLQCCWGWTLVVESCNRKCSYANSRILMLFLNFAHTQLIPYSTIPKFFPVSLNEHRKTHSCTIWDDQHSQTYMINKTKCNKIITIIVIIPEEVTSQPMWESPDLDSLSIHFAVM